MLSYQKLASVVGDQVKNLKLVHERKRDEHDNLMEALREMQADGGSKERIGKLYFIIMLSRWQEASVNKKYEAVIGEVKDLRHEICNLNTMSAALEASIEMKEQTIRDANENIVNL